jgi:hypothetical protein
VLSHPSRVRSEAVSEDFDFGDARSWWRGIDGIGSGAGAWLRVSSHFGRFSERVVTLWSTGSGCRLMAGVRSF